MLGVIYQETLFVCILHLKRRNIRIVLKCWIVVPLVGFTRKEGGGSKRGRGGDISGEIRLKNVYIRSDLVNGPAAPALR